MLFAVGVLALLLLLVAGVPIGFSMALVGVLGVAALRGLDPAVIMIGQVGVDAALNYSFSVLPLFVLMGNVIGRTRMAADLYAAAHAFLGHRPGGLAMATIAASGGFAAVAGSSYACAATLTNISVPAMRQRRYDAGFAAASVAAGGTLGVLIPPSIGMVFYSLITGVSLAQLMVAGVLPGLLSVLLYLAAIRVAMLAKPGYGPPSAPVPWRLRLAALAPVWPVAFLFCLVLGGIYAGVCTAMEAAGVGAFGAIAIALLRRSLDLAALRSIVVETVKTTANLFLVFFGALLFANFVTLAGLPSTIEAWIAGSGLGPFAVLAAAVLIYVALGCILESSSLLLLTLPIFFPALTGLGFDPVWLGVFVLIVAEIGLITPPIGMNVFVVKSSVADVPLQRIFLGLIPFGLADLLRLLVIILFPGIVLLLPGLMG